MLSKLIAVFVAVASLTSAATAQGHLAILIDRSPVQAPYPTAIAPNVAATLANQYAYGDQITIVSTGQPGAGAIDLDAAFDYRLGLRPDDIAGILQPLIGHAVAHPDPSSDWVASLEDLSARLDCASGDVTIVVVSTLADAMERNADGGFTVYPSAAGALTGCHLVFAGAGHGAAPGDRRQITELAGTAATFWGATHVVP